MWPKVTCLQPIIASSASSVEHPLHGNWLSMRMLAEQLPRCGWLGIYLSRSIPDQAQGDYELVLAAVLQLLGTSGSCA